MAGKVRRGHTVQRLDSPKTRAEVCDVRGQLYYRELLNNLHIGYRRGKRRGVWVYRRWLGDAHSVKNIALADDAEPAYGQRVLTFDQAKRRAIALADEAAKAAKGLTAPQVERRGLDRRRRDGGLSRLSRTRNKIRPQQPQPSPRHRRAQ
jgi:hypothetical protein